MHTMKQSFMFNSALNSQWNPLFSIEISFFDPHSLKNLITRFACYYSLRSYSQLASLVIRFLSLWGSKNEISLSTKWIPLFVANTVKQKPFVFSIKIMLVHKKRFKNCRRSHICHKFLWIRCIFDISCIFFRFVDTIYHSYPGLGGSCL